MMGSHHCQRVNVMTEAMKGTEVPFTITELDEADDGLDGITAQFYAFLPHPRETLCEFFLFSLHSQEQFDHSIKSSIKLSFWNSFLQIFFSISFFPHMYVQDK